MVRSRQALSGYVDRLLSEGRMVFTSAEAEDELGVGHRSFLDAAERLRRSRKLLRPRQGFYSEDIDLVRTSKGPIRPIIDRLGATLEPWHGAQFARSRVAPS